jgi:MFS family permease
VLSSLPYIVGGGANGSGGFASDWLMRRYGLQTGRRTIGAVGLGFAAIFMTATMFTTSGNWAQAFLTLAYAGILVQQPNLSALTLDGGSRNAGAVFGFMNMAGNAASSFSSIVFGYIVAYTNSYGAPFIAMVALLCVGVWLWVRVEPQRALFDDETTLHPPEELVV